MKTFKPRTKYFWIQYIYLASSLQYSKTLLLYEPKFPLVTGHCQGARNKTCYFRLYNVIYELFVALVRICTFTIKFQLWECARRGRVQDSMSLLSPSNSLLDAVYCCFRKCNPCTWSIYRIFQPTHPLWSGNGICSLRSSVWFYFWETFWTLVLISFSVVFRQKNFWSVSNTLKPLSVDPL